MDPENALRATFLTVAEVLPSLITALPGILFVAASYFIITLDRARANSPSKDDTQVGIKLVLYGLTIAGLGLATTGLNGFLRYALGGFKGGSFPLRMAMPSIIVGVVVMMVAGKVLLPRTNNATARQPERYALGFVAILYGSIAIGALSGVLTGIFASLRWADTSAQIASLVVHGAVGFLAILLLGARSGWTGPVRPVTPQAPPQGGGYPPPGGGYPPPGGSGYGPPSGGYNPQGGGYNPGGYNPQGGGGGFPPPGGGYPPA